MKETKAFGGDPAYSVAIKTILTFSDFQRALGEESFNSGGIDFKMLKKKAALKIIMKRVPWHGRMGKWQGLDDLGDSQEELNTHYELAAEWTRKNYPYLINPSQC